MSTPERLSGGGGGCEEEEEEAEDGHGHGDPMEKHIENI